MKISDKSENEVALEIAKDPSSTTSKEAEAKTLPSYNEIQSSKE